ncbi:uncharacterized protein TNCV_4136691 [Trichonephila clavipes]|nr:uncharacterized protein TNCV_4136691 [Trichonephila clavipes]
MFENVTLNSRRAASPLVGLAEGGERWEASDNPQGVLPQNWGGNEPNHTVTCMVLKSKANDRRKNLAFSRDEFRGPRSDSVGQDLKSHPSGIEVSNADCCAVGPQFESRRKHAGYSKQLSNNLSLEAGGSGRGRRPLTSPGCSPSKLGWNRAKPSCDLYDDQVYG